MSVDFYNIKKCLVRVAGKGQQLNYNNNNNNNNNVISSNYVKAKIDKTQQNSKRMLCGVRDEMINHISEAEN